jgi:AraC-like DNA-binding protein
MSITEAYQTFGFGDYSSFYRAFKKEYGISPKDFRDMQKDLLV